MKLTQEQIEEIRKRAEAATPGPWEVWRHRYNGYNGWVEEIGVGGFTADIDIESVEDAEFMAKARQDIPALLAHIAELEEQAAEDEEVKFGYYNENKMFQQRIAELESKVNSDSKPIIGFSERDEFDELMEAMNDDEE